MVDQRWAGQKGLQAVDQMVARTEAPAAAQMKTPAPEGQRVRMRVLPQVVGEVGVVEALRMQHTTFDRDRFPECTLCRSKA